jgi:hypothetical protein
MKYEAVERPGFFGRRKNEKIAALNKKYGEGKWELRHVMPFDPLPGTTEPVIPSPVTLEETYDFMRACKELYEESYFKFLTANPDKVALICAFYEVFDNADTNVFSGTDYTKQEAFSTHIQDIAIRNVLARLGRKFSPLPSSGLLQVRGPDSVGYQLGLNPGQVPFFAPGMITQPSLAPLWAMKGSVEDLWQSNKWVLRKLET